MINKIVLTGITLSALLLSGCGGGSNTNKKSITQQISERDSVVIIHGVNKPFCELVSNEVIKDNTTKDVILDSPANTVNCATYGKVNDNINCVEETLANMFDLTTANDITIYEDPSKACVIGANQK